MSGQEYLEAVKAELELGHHQHRMGENILGAFGYVRRRATAIDEINATPKQIGLVANPPIDSQMPLRSPRIRFGLPTAYESPKGSPGASEVPLASDVSDTHIDDETEDEEDVNGVLAPSFRISELASANRSVECISPDASIQKAYTTMALNKYSLLVVASSSTPRRQDIKGVVSYQSMAKALLSGAPEKVRDCLDDDCPIVGSREDLKDIVPMLGNSDVVLVVGQDNRLQGIVTAWDLAEEFAQLVDPFTRIGEIEARLRTLVGHKLDRDQLAQFLSDHDLTDGEHRKRPEELTIGELQRVVAYPQHWELLGLKALERVTFVEALDRIREFRNRLMHFRDPLSTGEISELANFCDLVREIPS